MLIKIIETNNLVRAPNRLKMGNFLNDYRKMIILAEISYRR